MVQNLWNIVIKGLIIGATMIVPGASGGTMAMILGIYDRLISAVGSFRKNPKDNFRFLTIFSMSAGLGLFLFSTPLSWLLETYEMPTMYFFIGAVIGGIPLIEKKSGIKKVDFGVLVLLGIGAILVVMLSRIPGGIFGTEAAGDGASWILLLNAGIVSAAALILPGISFSHFLLVLGLYDQLLNAVKMLELTFLLPLGTGVLLGIILLSKILENVMQKYPKQTYLMILGFIIGSVAEIIPGIPKGAETIGCVATATAGFFATYRKIMNKKVPVTKNSFISLETAI